MFILKKLKDFKNFFGKYGQHLKSEDVEEIARRYFVMNGFDGALVVLGIVMGSRAVGVEAPHSIIGASLGACLAMGISGFWGAYMAERAERTRDRKALERALFMNLENSALEKASRAAILWIAFIDGISPAVVAILAASPFFLAILHIIPVELAFYSSVGITLVMLFILGIFLGKISGENVLIHGVKMITAGIVISLIFIFFSFI